MQRSKNDFLVEFDTTKRQRYSRDFKLKVCAMHKDGKSYRKIAKELNIPLGSISKIIQDYGEKEIKEVTNKYLINRAEARERFEMTDSSFDYYRSAYPQYFEVINNVVYVDYRFLEAYVEERYGNRYWQQKD